MAESFEWCLSVGLAIGSGLLAVACEQAAISCTETATCTPTVRPDGGADVESGVGEDDAGSAADMSADPAEPPADGRVDTTIDSGSSEASETDSPDDVLYDGFDALTDAASEPDACDPGTSKSPAESTCLIGEKYGLFVSPQGSDTVGIGTRGAPYKTLARALQSAKGNVMRVYACDDGTGYPDALAVDATLDGMSLYGGFECTGWSYATTRRAKVHPATGVALTIKGLTVGLTLEDFEFDAADAAIGASSIGAIVDTAVNVVLRGVKVVAGNGGAGADGVDGAKGDDGPMTSAQQAGVDARCPAQFTQQNGGSWGGSTLCGSRGGSRGGNGGTANQGLGGSNGVSGIPMTDITTPNIGTGGPPGEDGASGSDGIPGAPGATSSAPGSFAANGYTLAPSGGDGADGHSAQGGGGGGASNASGLCIGASGGAGGMGGCGGLPGTGGASAGASVALLSWMSPITLDHCELISASGGAGGSGGNGGSGGAGKAGAAGGAASDDAGPALDAGTGPGKGGSGGPGGNGGNGGSGAGGNGGPSYSLVYKGSPPLTVDGTFLAHGAGGAKGTGGSVDTVKAPDGITGPASDEFSVP